MMDMDGNLELQEISGKPTPLGVGVLDYNTKKERKRRTNNRWLQKLKIEFCIKRK